MPLEPWIIEEIRRREEEKRRQEEEQKREQPSAPVYEEPPEDQGGDTQREPVKEDRGVVIINPDGTEERDKGSKAYGAVIWF